MRARYFNKLVEIWQAIPKPDGYGGFTTNDVYVKSVWARISNTRGYNDEADGGLRAGNVYEVTMWYNPDLLLDKTVNFLKINNKRYTIASDIEHINLDRTRIRFTINESSN